MCRTPFRAMATSLAMVLLVVSAPTRAQRAGGWQQSFRAAANSDPAGRAIGGTEIVHLVAHKGRLYAGNGYWMDPRGHDNTPWSQVLVLKSPDARWTVDLALGPRHLRVTALESVTFATDAAGKALTTPARLLLAASDHQGGPTAPYRETNIWTRDDRKDTWVKTTLQAGRKHRRSVRAFAVHRDRRTGINRIVVAAGALGIYGGVYCATEPGTIRWDTKAELGPVAIRPMSFAEAAGSLYASAGPAVYRRIDGPVPRWEKVYRDETPQHWELGGIRGLTAVASPTGSGQSLLFSHTDRILRLDPAAGHRATVELNVRKLLERRWGRRVPGAIIAAYSHMLPLTDPATGRTVHVLGVQGRVQRGGKKTTYRADTFFGWYPGGSYLIRDSDGRYRLKEVNGPWRPGKPMLVAVRTFAVSPFANDDAGVLYVGGFDANFFPARDTAWIFRAPLQTALATPPPKRK